MKVVLVVDNHCWAQKLPLRENRLVCVDCGFERPMRSEGQVPSCASVMRLKGIECYTSEEMGV